MSKLAAAALDTIVTYVLQSICENTAWDLEADDDATEQQLEDTLIAIAKAIREPDAPIELPNIF